jgi:ABC-2 type transport system permease protein
MLFSPAFRMIAAVELRRHYREGVLTILGVMMIVLLGATLTARTGSFRANEDAARAASQRVREQWINQGTKHPHSGAHFGTYVFRKALPLEVLEPGITNFTGQIIPLVTHQREFPIDRPVESSTSFTRYGELSPGVVGLALLSLFAVLTGYGVVAADRRDGTLRLLLASGASPLAIVSGKVAGLASAMGILWLVKVVIEGLAARPASVDQWLRFVAFEGVHLVYAAIWVLIAVSVSTLVRQPGTALALLLLCWIGNTILLPRIASSVVRLALHEPSAAEFSERIRHDISFREDGSEWVNAWSQKLIADTLRHYGVSRIEDLPVGYAGIMLKSSDAHYEAVFDKHFRQLHQLHERQQRWHHALSFLGPWVAARSLLEGFAGSDLAHSAHLSDEAESYRRLFVEATNDAAERQGKGTGWELEVGRAYWQSIPDFRYSPPSIGWAAAHQFTGIVVMSLWLFAALSGLYLARRRLERGA